MLPAQRRTAVTASMAAPIGGWNARDSLAEMNPLDAVELVNWYPTPSDLLLRKGYSRFATGITGEIDTLMNYAGETGQKLFAAAGNTIYEVTGGTTTTAFTGIGSDVFQHTMISTAGGQFLVACNGVDPVLVYNGTYWFKIATTSTGQKLFAAAGNTIYEVTGGTTTTAFTGISSDIFQHAMISTAGGQFLVACNGVDPVLVYNGTYWFKIATTSTGQTINTITRGGTGNLTATVTTASAHGLVTGNQVTVTGASPTEYNGTYRITVTSGTTFTYTMASAPATDATTVGTYLPTGITGIDSSRFININLYKNRLWFVEKDSMSAWYLETDSLAGAAAEINLGGVASNGGYLQAMGTWTIDAGQGVDDYAVFVSSMGETMVYAGLDPTDPNNWALRGVWQIGQTFNRRCFFKFAGDLLLITKDGLVPLAGALQSSRLDPRINLTDKIFWAVSQATDAYSANFGWQINYYANQNMLILNIPTNSGQEQYVMHTITKSWAKFTGINAKCWEIHNNEMFFGSNGFVGRFWDTYSDAGTNINGTVQQAYSYFESRGQLKRFTMIRPIFQTSGGIPTIVANVNIDFVTQDVTGTVTFNPATVVAGVWDASTWDNAAWGGGLEVNKVWQGVNGIGYSAGIYMKVASQRIEVRWASTDYVMERGGVI